MICMLGLLALTSCGHFGTCSKDRGQCDLHKSTTCAQCGKENCTKCPKDHAQCPMSNTAAPEAAKK